MNSVNKLKRKVHPKQNANFLSKATFLYAIPTFLQGYRKGFEENDIYQTLPEYRSEVLANKIEVLWINELKSCGSNRGPSLIRVLIRAFGLEFVLMALMITIIDFIVKPMQAVFLGRLILFYMPADDTSHTTKFDAYFYAIGIIFLTIARVALFHPVTLQLLLIGLRVKVSLCSLVYRKALKLNNAALNKTSVGQILNLISNDVTIFVRCTMVLNYMWVGPTQCIIITWLMYREVGYSSIVGIGLLCFFTPLYYFLGRATSKYRLKVALRTDKRVTYMNEILFGIKVIKMYAWEKPIGSVLFSFRKLEMKYLRLSSYIKAAFNTFDVLVIPTLLYSTIVVYVWHNNIRADKVFALTIFYNNLRTMATFFPQSLTHLSEALVSVNRITTFLLHTEVKLESTESKPDLVAIGITNGTAKWKSEITLHNINLTIKNRSLIIVIGAVGCGKSSLLSVMLRELPLENGTLQLNGRISYASQDPWLFDGTVQDNILFGAEMNVARYNEVVRRCALECDFKLLPFADNTVVGRRGSSLSGGQKARINLARAVYRDADIYLLDDPLSAVDSRVGDQIFEECIKDFLKDKSVVLVTHQLKYLTDADEVIVIKNGTIESQGEWKGSSTLEGKTDEGDDNSITKKCTDELINENTKKMQEIVKEQKSVGRVSKNVYMSYIKSGGHFIFIIWIVLLFLITQALLSGSAYFLSHWVNQAQMEKMYDEENHINIERDGNFTNIREFQKPSEEVYIFMYTIIISLLIFISLTRSYMFFSLCLRASAKLHNNMFKNVICATMHFFNTNSQGRIINRFSQDMSTVDNILPIVAINATQVLLLSIASCLLVAIVNYWLLIPTFIIACILYYLNRFCLHASRDIKRLEGVTRSPVFEHLSSSLQGLNTIRAYQAQEKLIKEFDCHQDLHSCSSDLFLTTSQGFGYFLDIICSVYVAVVTLSFVIYDNGALGGDVGLAITQCIAITGTLQWALQQLAELENNLTSVERILEYNSIEQESKLDKCVRASWPEDGQITFSNVSLKYSADDLPVLKNVSFKIASKEKIGIIGRTGAGKSSLINAVFRLSNFSGNILIDNIDITELSLQELRSSISIIPQDPVLFSGTLRYNLDPFDEWDEHDLWIVLEEVELKHVVKVLPLGLHTIIGQNGSNLSVGQRQLLCLARSILRNNRILVLDEATASVDSATDALIQKTVRKKFKECTVLTIAHRIDTIMDSDKILVMSAGKVIEFDKPSVLLQNIHGYFYEMVHNSK